MLLLASAVLVGLEVVEGEKEERGKVEGLEGGLVVGFWVVVVGEKEEGFCDALARERAWEAEGGREDRWREAVRGRGRVGGRSSSSSGEEGIFGGEGREGIVGGEGVIWGVRRREGDEAVVFERLGCMTFGSLAK